MDPTETELQAITNALERALREALGDPADGTPGPLRDLTLVEKARVESSRRVALLPLGIAPE